MRPSYRRALRQLPAARRWAAGREPAAAGGRGATGRAPAQSSLKWHPLANRGQERPGLAAARARG
jgi:hypothetical protein